LDARSLEGHLVGYTEFGHMFRIYIPSQRKVDTFRQVKFEPSSSYTSVDIHNPSLLNEADIPLTTLIPLRPNKPTLLPKTTTAEPQITLPPLRQQSAEYEQFSDEDSESERVPGEPSVGASTPPRQISTTTPSAPKSSRRKDFSEVPETPKLDYESYPKRSTKGPDCYSESGWARLVAEPNSYQEAVSSLDADAWQQAILEEHQVIEEAGTWSVHNITDLPKGRKPVGSQWVFKVKHHADGSIERHKARINAKGYSQQEGLDYDETFAPVTRYDSLRLIIALALHLGPDMEQLDIKSAFLNGELKEEIWMIPPPGIGLDGKILRLHKALYSLKQGPLQWFEKLATVLAELGFVSLTFDPCVFINITLNVILVVYVDDITTVGPKPQIEILIDHLKSHFKVTVKGGLKYILGIEVNETEHGLELCQR